VSFIEKSTQDKHKNINNLITSDFYEEMKEGMCDTAAISLAEGRDNIIDSDNEINRYSKKYNIDDTLDNNTLVGNDIIELLDYNKTIIANIEKRQALIAKAQNSFNTMQGSLSYYKSQNLELEKQIEKISIEKAKEVQAIKSSMLELEIDKNNQIEKISLEKAKEIQVIKNYMLKLEKDKNDKIEKLSQDIKFLQEEKDNKIKELNDELLSIKKSYDDELVLLNRNYDNFKLEKEEQVITLQQEIEKSKVEIEEDKKVLDEFQTMIKILERIKGIFKKN